MTSLMNAVRKKVGAKVVKETKGFGTHTPEFVLRSLTSFNFVKTGTRVKAV